MSIQSSAEEEEKELFYAAKAKQLFTFCCEICSKSESKDEHTFTMSYCKENKFMTISLAVLDDLFTRLVSEGKLQKLKNRVPTYKIDASCDEAKRLMIEFVREAETAAAALASVEASDSSKKRAADAIAPQKCEENNASIKRELSAKSHQEDYNNLAKKQKVAQAEYTSKSKKEYTAKATPTFAPTTSFISNTSSTLVPFVERKSDVNKVELFSIISKLPEHFSLSILRQAVETSSVKDNLLTYLDQAEDSNYIFQSKHTDPDVFIIYKI